ncbi:MAG: hypothetical protein A3F09_00550 [Chlamydiae bacterium RIFCSPHIGHO2_12_FULL_49_11]|nr:MAG: hypothetical protein A3F09_00550 [Chlamydiae bacterium RIFCSPHIGHO2_12_FULL_49_11]
MNKEEEVRRAFIDRLVEEWGFPRSLISIEKKVGRLRRRYDALVFKRGREGLIPLLLIECKAVSLKREMFDQLTGYNVTIGAPFVALCNGQEIWLGRKGESGYHAQRGLKPYQELVSDSNRAENL